MVAGCYVAYKEARHHELHKLRAEFTNLEEKIVSLKDKELADRNIDPETDEIFKGEMLGYEKVLEIIKKEDADCDLIQEIEDDIKKVKEKISSLFKKKDIA